MKLTARIIEVFHKSEFENYLTHHETINWTHITNNWNAVCHQGVLGAALALADAPVCASMLAIATEHLRSFLSGYGEDGGCQEGPGYWDYGFGRMAVLNEQLETASRGELSFFEGDEHIRQIAFFGARTSLSGDCLVNFSDCAPRGRLNPRLFLYLGRLFGQPLLTGFGNAGYRKLAESGIDVDAERSDLFHLVRLLRDMPEKIPDDVPPPAADFYFRDTQVLVSRAFDRTSCLWELAAKGGHNGEHHNHNDCGSFILNIDGERLISEIGTPEYTRDFFSPKRYEYLAARTLGHSLPIVGGCEQAEGSQHAARVLEESITARRIRFVLEIAACYPAESTCNSLIRSFDLDRRAGELFVEDRYEIEAGLPIETAIVTCANAVEIEGGVLIRSGKSAVEIVPTASTVVGGIETHAYSDHGGRPASILRIVLRPAQQTRSGALSYHVRVATAAG
jgi:hypothetical protein